MHLATKLLTCSVFVLSLAGGRPAFANDAVILLNQMYDALHTLEYQGKLVYIKDGEVTNLSIRHTIENGAEKEAVSLLDQNSDEYIKESNVFSLSSLPKINQKMQEVYSFDMGGMAKVAGRPCRIVLARPKDRKRYLQKYCIDLDRSVVLKYSLINQHHQPVERFMFTDFEVISSQDTVTEAVQPKQAQAIDLGGASTGGAPPVMARANKMTNSMAPANLSADNESAVEFVAEATDNQTLSSGNHGNGTPDKYSEWFFDPLPAGFAIVSADKVKNPTGEDEQIVISDGLSSVSVFISANKETAKPFNPIRSGALNILSRDYQGYVVTLVGEVPESTLHDIYMGIKKATID